MDKKIAYLGIDYHLKSLIIAVLIEGEREIYNVIFEKSLRDQRSGVIKEIPFF